MYIKEIIIPIVLSLIGVGGTLGGVFVANHQNAVNEKDARLYIYQTKIIEQRINLVDRTAKIFGKSPGLHDTWEHYLNNKVKGVVDQPVVDELTEAQGEFQSIIFLTGVYFGPKTKQALKDLSETPGPWWEKPKEKQDNFVGSMASEIDYKIQ